MFCYLQLECLIKIGFNSSRHYKMRFYLTLFYSTVLLIAMACKSSPKTSPDDRPNIILIIADDLGKEWISGYGAEDIETPNIDALINKGIKFNNVYAMPQCTPTRLTLLTGQYPYEHGWVNHWDVPRWGGGAHFDESINPCFPKELQKGGYETLIAGKWQIDDFRVEPDALTRAGFDHYCMWTGGEGNNPPSDERYQDPYIFTKGGSRIMKGAFGPDIFKDFIVDFIKGKREQPFFVYYPMVLPHTPFVNTPIDSADSNLGKHKAMVNYVDKLTGDIIKALDDNGLGENTIVVWTGDNGTTGRITGSLLGESVKGGKSKTSQNGIDVPFIVKWPKHIKKSSSSAALIDFTDIYPSFLDIAGVTVKGKEGTSFYDILKDPSITTKRDWVMSMGGGNHAALTNNGVENQYRFRDRVIRDKQYKLYVNSNREADKFFDLLFDPFEKEDLMQELHIDNRKERLEVLLNIILAQPLEDSEPRYTPNPAQSWDVEISEESKKWKL